MHKKADEGEEEEEEQATADSEEQLFMNTSYALNGQIKLGDCC